MWKEACYEECLEKQQWIKKDRWAAGAVKGESHHALQSIIVENFAVHSSTVVPKRKLTRAN
jgi:hypothetical protein